MDNQNMPRVTEQADDEYEAPAGFEQAIGTWLSMRDYWQDEEDEHVKAAWSDVLKFAAPATPQAGAAVGHVEKDALTYLKESADAGIKTSVKLYSFASESRGITVPVFAEPAATTASAVGSIGPALVLETALSDADMLALHRWQEAMRDWYGRAPAPSRDAAPLNAVEKAWRLGLAADVDGFADLRVDLARAPLPAQEGVPVALAYWMSGDPHDAKHMFVTTDLRYHADYQRPLVFGDAAPAQAGDARDDFTRGYFCAVAVALREDGDTTIVRSMFSSGGDPTTADPFDVELFIEHGLLDRAAMSASQGKTGGAA